MIFGYFGCPAMGIKGAAIATVISQMISGGMSTTLYFIKNPSLRLNRKSLRFRIDLAGEIYKVAVPMMIATATNSIIMMVTNRVLESISTLAIAFYGIFGKLQTFMFMPVNGLSQGIVPIIGYFYGAKNAKKIRQTTKFSLKIGISVMIFGMLVFFIFPAQLMAIYDASENLLSIGLIGLRVLAITFFPQAYILIYGNIFNALGNGMVNMKCSFIRGILPIPLLLILVRLWGTQWCWFAFVIADTIAALIAHMYYRQLNRTILEKL